MRTAAWILVLACLGIGGSVRADEDEDALVAEPLLYRAGDVECEGLLVVAGEDTEKRPAVLVFHAWKGIGDHERDRAIALALEGYVVLCADVYGKGVRPSTSAEAGKEAGKYKADRALTRARATAALEALRKDPRVDGERIAAIGFCFGGMVALELARSGADLDAVASFHGSLDSPAPEDGKKIRAKVLALHGADDPHVKRPDIDAWKEEMRQGGVDWTFTEYGGAVHSFTDPHAGSDPSTGSAYHERSAVRAWEAMTEHLEEAFETR
jgi:dienelactone hydrolase